MFKEADPITDKQEKNTQSSRLKARPTIGLLIANITRPWEIPQWRGIRDAAQEQDLNLICFPGGELCSILGFDVQANVLYKIVNAERLDGLIIWTAGFDNYISQEKLKEFCAQYHPLPIVSIEDPIPGIPSLVIDNYQSMREAIVHLIEVHGCRRLAFSRHLTGGRFGFDERYRAYVETLADYGIPFDPNLVFPLLDDTRGEARNAALAEWLRPERVTAWDALASYSDDDLLFAVQVMQAQGIRIPQDLAVVGYNDVKRSQVTTPPLTTVHPPFYEMGRYAIQTLLALLAGESVPEQIKVPSRLAIRQSCGCQDPIVAGVGEQRLLHPLPTESFTATFSQQRPALAAELLQAAKATRVEGIQAQVEQLLDDFTAEVTGQASNVFLPQFEELLRLAALANHNLAAWHEALSALRHQALPYLTDREHRSRAGDLWEQARILLAAMVERRQANQQLLAEEEAEKLRQVSQALVTTFNVDELTHILAQELPKLGISHCYLALYEDPETYRYPQPAPIWSRLVLAYTEQGRLELEPGGQRFLTRQLAPEEMLPQDRRYTFVLKSLYFRESQIGFILFEAKPHEETIYDVLRGEISSALENSRLLHQLEEKSRQLEIANQHKS